MPEYDVGQKLDLKELLPSQHFTKPPARYGEASLVKELEKKGITEPLEVISKNLQERDRIDSTREDSPLKMAEDAIEIDTSYLTLDEQIDKIVSMAESLIYES